ncbi:bifunctional phosphopantothenoylcysteine decarboxylase/phosphopantothenate--cysteine ligase CoaBC [Terriglobus aquaticus]|uniref:Coenzyme A biosynthesis bifunctional protein CoaBC n=1 Tax=Terriglobus aquaticus TaxID=940139 RepID=A0ABW9KGQ6_9BACT|nr:bifunctional phosphopantothenoylcysteine decarboxylase/phosphopantothenate--cysteine ligase CoaBC [Terriglobus aquaticus]
MKILLGVSGGIAAYKAVELMRDLGRRGFDVQIAMTQGAQHFITPLTFAALSGHPVLTSIWQEAEAAKGDGSDDRFTIDHTRIAQEIQALVVAPATANTLARLANGMADDPISTIALATRAPLFLAPAMNVHMWNHPATQANMRTLQARGAQVIAPAEGLLACGVVGEGRLAETNVIVDALTAALEKSRDLSEEHILITAGGTREPIDPVRFLGNRSSGKMGHALAEAALARGARVVLVTTASHLSAPGCEIVPVSTAAEMQSAVLTRLRSVTAVIMAAAVADFRPAHRAAHKISKSEVLTLELVRNDDILHHVVAQRSPGTLVIGFAAQTRDVLEEGRRKLREKGVDAIVANDVSAADRGFDADQNAGYFLTRQQETLLALSSKRVMADRILDGLRDLAANRTI